MKTKLLAALIVLGLVDAIIPIPIVGLVLVYVVLERPPWFLQWVDDIYGRQE